VELIRINRCARFRADINPRQQRGRLAGRQLRNAAWRLTFRGANRRWHKGMTPWSSVLGPLVQLARAATVKRGSRALERNWM
jgi:hypothetical protein